MSIHNISQKIRQHTEAAENGNVQSMVILGNLYKEGTTSRECPIRNIQSAIKWYNKAAEFNNADALYELGCIHTNNENESKEYLKKAADLGNVDAMILLAEDLDCVYSTFYNYIEIMKKVDHDKLDPLISEIDCNSDMDKRMLIDYIIELAKDLKCSEERLNRIDVIHAAEIEELKKQYAAEIEELLRPDGRFVSKSVDQYREHFASE